MRRRIYILLAVLVCRALTLSAGSAPTALNPEQHHFLGLWADFGYIGWLNNAPGAKVPSGVAPAIGFGYRYYQNSFIFQTGLEGQFQWMQSTMKELQMQQQMVDTDIDPEPFTMHISLFNRKDVYQLAEVHIPLYFGYEKQRFFFLAGVTAGMSVYGTASSDCMLTTQADYDRLIGVMEDMPNHGLTSLHVSNGNLALKTNINIMGHFEAGARVDKYNPKAGFYANRHTYRMYLSAYADYGLLNIHPNKSLGPQLSMDYTSGVQATIIPLMMSDEMMGKNVNPLSVGVKFTVMFELPQAGKSYIYNYKDVDKDYRKRGGNQTINQ